MWCESKLQKGLHANISVFLILSMITSLPFLLLENKENDNKEKTS